MAVGLENHRRSLSVRVDPHDAHHHNHPASTHSQTQNHHWWHWRSSKKQHTPEAPAPQTQTQTHRRHHHARPHHHHHHYSSNALVPKSSTLTKRLSSATAFNDDAPSIHGRRKRIVLHAIFKC